MGQHRDPRGIGRKGGFKSLGSNLPQYAYKGRGWSVETGVTDMEWKNSRRD